MTFNEQKLEELGFFLSDYGISITSKYQNAEPYDSLVYFIKQALIDKEKEVLERVMKCLPKINEAITGYDYCDDDEDKLVNKVVKSILDKEFKQ